MLRIFLFTLTNPTASAGFEPANLGTKGHHATSRPPKPLINNELEIFSNSFRITVLVSYGSVFVCVCVDWINLAQKRKERRTLTDKQTNKYSFSIISIKEGE